MHPSLGELLHHFEEFATVVLEHVVGDSENAAFDSETAAEAKEVVGVVGTASSRRWSRMALVVVVPGTFFVEFDVIVVLFIVVLGIVILVVVFGIVIELVVVVTVRGSRMERRFPAVWMRMRVRVPCIASAMRCPSSRQGDRRQSQHQKHRARHCRGRDQDLAVEEWCRHC